MKYKKLLEHIQRASNPNMGDLFRFPGGKDA